ncbi:MAG: hypothetical protein K0R13_1737 [Propionibacteriaceae bacterium]|jgi:hypothetical protein|nr:hypothetical protein [Propionibacteriaceae bacterium]
MLWQLVRVSCFPSTAVLNAGMSQSYCGAAVGKTRGSPCLGGYKINGRMDGSHAALSWDRRGAAATATAQDLKWSNPAGASHTAPSTKT